MNAAGDLLGAAGLIREGGVGRRQYLSMIA